MTKDEIIKAAANKLMGWKLPQDFCPDCYISFDSAKANDMKSWPTGTNLLHVSQAIEMISYCLSEFLIAPENGELDYATLVAKAIYSKHYKDDTPYWKPLPDLMGVISQIDNMTAGLDRNRPNAVNQGLLDALRAVTSALERLEHLTPPDVGATWSDQYISIQETLNDAIEAAEQVFHPAWSALGETK